MLSMNDLLHVSPWVITPLKMELSAKFYQQRTLQTLVENQTTYALNHAEMHIFETHQEADKVLLKFHNPVLASMLVGKKVMHLRDSEAFAFLPGESLILPANEMMCIDFPEARMDKPTRCLAMTIDEDMITQVINNMNELMPKTDHREWRFTPENFHFTNDAAIYQILQRLMFLFTENHPSKDMFVDMSLKELIIRVLQTEERQIYNDKTLNVQQSHRLAFVIRFIRENLSEPLSIEELARKVHMSESNFHRVFKNELGVSPVQFINNERIKLATSLLQDAELSIKEVYLEAGFNSLSYFNRLFKRENHMSPSAFQDRMKHV